MSPRLCTFCGSPISAKAARIDVHDPHPGGVSGSFHLPSQTGGENCYQLAVEQKEASMCGREIGCRVEPVERPSAPLEA